MSGPILMDDVMGKIKSAIGRELKGGGYSVEAEPSNDLMQEIRNIITDGLVRYRADRTIYESAVGNFIVEQNPYTTWENLILPNLPVNPNGENKWVRKAGPLAENHAGKPLDYQKEIPGGDNVVFSWAVWDYLADPNEEGNPTPPVPTTYVATGTTDDPLAPPESDPVRTDKVPAKLRHHYGHNIVKAVRLKYRFLDRRYKPTDTLATELKVRDVHTGYILIMYSGSDGS